MQITKIEQKSHTLARPEDFFSDTDRLMDTILDTKEIWLIVQDYSRMHGNITDCVVSRVIEKFGPDRVVVVVSSGMHRASSQSEMDAMIGTGVTQRLRVYTHNPLQIMKLPSYAYKIGIHCSSPHNFVGMSNAGKMLIPGLSDYKYASKWHKGDCWDAKREMENICHNFDAVFDYCVNVGGEMIGWHVGKGGGMSYESYLDIAKELYKVKIPEVLPDVCILRPLHKTEDFLLLMNAMNVCKDRKVVKDGGTICIQHPLVDSMGTHYLFQQPNGLTPAVYDRVFEYPYRNANIAFVTPKLPRSAIQEYFEKQVFCFDDHDRFKQFVHSLYGEKAVAHEYIGSDLMIGVDE